MTIFALDQAAGSSRSAGGWHALTSRPIVRRAASIAAAAAMIAVDAHFIGPYVARAATVLTSPVLYWVAIALAAEIVSILATAALQRRMLQTTGTRVTKRTAVGIAYAGYAVNMSLPAGPAVSAGYTFRRLRHLGASVPAAGFTLISSGVLNVLSYALVAVVGFTLAGGSASGPVAVVMGVVAAGLLVFVTRSLFRHPEVLERVGLRALRVVNRVRRREPDAGSAELRHSTNMLTSIRPSGQDWAAGMSSALINWVGDLICLFASCQAVGANGATIGVVMLAYLAGTSVSGVSLVPGGLGVVDAALIVILVHNGVGVAPATAAVFLYRALSFGFGVIAGWSAWIGHARAVRHSAHAAVAAPERVRTARPAEHNSRITTHPASTATPSIWRHHDHHAGPRPTPHDPIAGPAPEAAAPPRDASNSPHPRASYARRVRRPQPDQIRFPGRSQSLTDRGRHTASLRGSRVPPLVRRERIQSHTRRGIVPCRAAPVRTVR